MNEESIDDVYLDTELKMDQSVEVLRKNFSNIHAGRLTPAILEHIKVDYYGKLTPVSQVGTLSTPEPQMIAINPWEKSMLKEIERAILKANLDLSVSNDGNLIRAVMPPLTEDRRKDMVKQIKKIGEDCKIAIRNARREGNESLKKLEKDKHLSKDDEKIALQKIQELTDKHIESVDGIISKKVDEMMTI
ncbi:ribosome recycling factor [Deltaproteobacteria bacterium TL4]